MENRYNFVSKKFDNGEPVDIQRIPITEVDEKLKEGYSIGFNAEDITLPITNKDIINKIRHYVYCNMTYDEMNIIISHLDKEEYTNVDSARVYINGITKDKMEVFLEDITDHLIENLTDYPNIVDNISKDIIYCWYNQSLINYRLNRLSGAYSLGNVNQYRTKLIGVNNVTCNLCNVPLNDDNAKIVILDNDNHIPPLTDCLPLCNNCINLVNNNLLATGVLSKSYNLSFIKAMVSNNIITGDNCTLKIDIKLPISPIKGTVYDSAKLDNIVNEFILSRINNDLINRYIKVPTYENIIYWAWCQLSISIRGIYAIHIITNDNNEITVTRNDIKLFINNNALNDKSIYVDDDIIKELEQVVKDNSALF